MPGNVKKNWKSRFPEDDLEGDDSVDHEKREKQKSQRRSEYRERRRNKEHHDDD